jgi:hypothetical protein
MHLLIESTKSMKTKEFFLAFCDAPSIFILLLGPHTLVALTIARWKMVDGDLRTYSGYGGHG